MARDDKKSGKCCCVLLIIVLLGVGALAVDSFLYPFIPGFDAWVSLSGLLGL